MPTNQLSNAQLKQFLINAKSRDIHFSLVDGKLKSQAAKGAITLEDRNTVKANKDALMDILASAAAPAKAKIQARPDNVCDMSFAQTRLWFIDSVQGGSAEYNIAMAFEVTGQLDTELVTAVFNTIVERHEVLRTVYIEEDGQTIQHVRPMNEINFAINVEDLSHLAEDALESQIRTVFETDIVTAFNLETDLMLRVCYMRKSADSGVITFNMHHIASDGWSMQVLTKEFFTLYQAYSHDDGKSRINPLPPLAIQYADYAHWQREYLEGEVLDAQLNYWEKQLDELPVVHSLPLDYARPQTKQPQAAKVKGELPATVAKALLEVAKVHKLTPFMLLHGALSLLLSRHSNSNDIVIGTPIANRLQAELEPLIGFFVNTLVLRVDTAQNTLTDLFGHIRQVHQDAQSNQDVPFEQLVERLKVPRSMAHGPLIQILLRTNTDFGVNDESQGGFSLPGVDIEPFKSDVTQSQFELEVDLSLSEHGVGLSWTYNVSLFSQAHITQLNNHLCRLFETLAQSLPTQSPHSLGLLSEAEVAHLMYDSNDTQVDYAKEQCIHELFEQQVLANPNNVAVTFGDTQLSYAELNQKANQLAHYLQTNHGVKPDTLVGLCVERSLEMVIGIVAILKAGGAYVPLDPGYPQDRLNYMFDDAALDVVLSQTAQQDLLSSFGGTVLMLDELLFDEPVIENQASDNLAKVASNNLAYMIYTSGSTGNPKGVMVEHQALFNRIHWMNNKYGMSADDKVLQKTPYSFDVSVWEFVWTLAYGAELVVAKPQGHQDPEYLCELIVAKGITKMHFVPSMLGVILEVDAFKNASSIKQVFCSGEALQQGHVLGFRQTLPGAQLHNLYGPTEAAIDVSYWDCSGDISHGVPIGKPIDNIQLVILDAHLNVVPKGAVGELHIGGDGLARGYHNRADLTEQTFINNPFFDASKTNSSKRLYKTGDLARLREDGEIEYQGRTDHQVKIRGLRIELGEIEHRLGGLSVVDSALVLAKELAGSMQLIAYVKSVQAIGEQDMAEQDMADYIGDIKAQLSQTMPAHMVPGIIMVLEQWPLTPNGKVDRKALPSADGSALQGEYVAPQTAAEQTLVDVCAELLNIDAATLSTSANFFELGGHSLMGLKVVTGLRKHDMSLSINDILTHNTLVDLAEKIGGAVALTGSKSAIEAGCTHITPDMLDLVELSQTELDLLMADSDGKEAAGGVTGGAANIQDIYPLSPLQQGIFYQTLVQTDIDPYITYQIFSVDGDAAYQKFIEAFEHLVAQHDILRTSFHWQQLSQPVQVVERAAVLPIELLPDAPNAEQLIGDKLAARTFRFNIEKAPMLNFTVCKEAGTQAYTIGIEFHHLVDDNIAIGIFASQVERFMAGDVFTVPYEKQYRNYIQRVVDTPLDEAEAFFKSSLCELSQLSYIFDVKEQNQTQTLSKAVDAQTLTQLKAVAKKYKVGLPTIIHAAWSMVVGMTSGHNHVVFGTVLSGRMGNVAGMEDMAGPLINTLPLAVNLDTTNLVELFGHVELALKNLVKYEYTPLSMAKECCDFNVGGELFNSIVNYRFAEQATSASDTSDESAVQGTGGEELVHYPFALNADDNNSALKLSVSAPKHIGAQRMSDYLDNALNAIINTQVKTSVNLLPEPEVRQLVHDLNTVSVNYPKDLCIHQLFEQQALANPDNVAVVSEQTSLTYQQLNEKANQLAHHLKANHDIKPDTLVGLCVERSVEMMIGILAILKAGGAYVPFDPGYPQERLSFMLEDTGVDVVLSQSQVEDVLSGFKGTVLSIDGLAEQDNFCSAQPSTNLVLDNGLCASNLAYVIYTSGSTGQPKGVLTEHISVSRLVVNCDFMALNDKTVMLQSANIAFDAATLEIWGPLLSGGQSVLYPHPYLLTDELNAVVEQHQVNTLWLTAGLFAQWSNDVPQDSPLQTLLAGGDVLDIEAIKRVQQALPELTLINGYGPTENTTFSTTYTFDKPHTSDSVPIGKKLATDEAYIFNDACQLVPVGSVGQLYVGGDGLARGYLNRPELTAECFIDNPFYDATKLGSSKRLYKTGDLVRLLSDNDFNLAFIGRADNQVKIRGFRVELGEVEAQLAKVDLVDSAIVMNNDQQLVGYILPKESVAEDEQAPLIRSVLDELKTQLPTYMVPSPIMVIEQWPLTANGKVDRKALPAADGSVLQGEYVAPESPTEVGLADIWAQLLNIKPETISTTANFFELGGHSLLVIRLLSEIRSAFDIEVDIQQILQVNSLADLAEVLDGQLLQKNVQVDDDYELDDDEIEFEI